MLRSLARPRLRLSRTVSATTRAQSTIVSGQPLFETRPHLIRNGDITPGIPALEYFERRLRVASSMAKGSCAVVMGNTTKYRSGPVFYDFHQNPDFFYLSGFLEPEAALIIEKPSEKPEDVVFHMFVPPKDPQAELWGGARTGEQGAIDFFNADEAYSNNNLQQFKKIIDRNDTVYHDMAEGSKAAALFTETVETPLTRLLKAKLVSPLNPITAKLRAVKSSSEITVMRAAGAASSNAYNAAYANPFSSEKELQVYLESLFLLGGCEKPAYVPVIAGGSNALSIHYTRNDDKFKPNGLVLVDAGGQLGGYCADISRTWPVGAEGKGRFTDPQRDLYEAVLDIQKQCIEKCSTDVSINEIHEFSVRGLHKNLQNIGFDGLTLAQTQQLYPHYIGHHLGIDLHDVGKTNRRAPLQVGNVITIEPGVYVPEDARFPKHFHGIGIRIEDNVAITESGYSVLTEECIKEVDEIEELTDLAYQI